MVVMTSPVLLDEMYHMCYTWQTTVRREYAEPALDWIKSLDREDRREWVPTFAHCNAGRGRDASQSANGQLPACGAACRAEQRRDFCGFIKKTGKMPKADLDRALKRKRHWSEHDGNPQEAQEHRLIRRVVPC